jgi:O-antigen/teichoic acid export membrane protein
MDRLIVGAIIGPEAVALVEIATQIQTGAEAVLSATSYAVVPSASWLHARGDKQSLRDLLELGTKYSVMATAAVVALGVIFATPFVHVWVKPEYYDAAGLAMVALLYVAVTGPLQVGSNLLVGIGRAGPIVVAALFAVLVNLAASVVLVHTIGIVGCFIGSLIGSVALIPLLGRTSLRAAGSNLPTFLSRAVVPSIAPVFALAVVGVVVVALPLSDWSTLIVGVPLSFAAFSVVAARFSLSRDEIRSARGSLPST